MITSASTEAEAVSVRRSQFSISTVIILFSRCGVHTLIDSPSLSFQPKREFKSLSFDLAKYHGKIIVSCRVNGGFGAENIYVMSRILLYLYNIVENACTKEV
jgi:hypothetical protein